MRKVQKTKIVFPAIDQSASVLNSSTKIYEVAVKDFLVGVALMDI